MSGGFAFHQSLVLAYGECSFTYIFKTCIEPVLQNNVMVSYDSSEVILTHEKSQCLNGIFSAITEITDGIENV